MSNLSMSVLISKRMCRRSRHHHACILIIPPSKHSRKVFSPSPQLPPIMRNTLCGFLRLRRAAFAAYFFTATVQSSRSVFFISRLPMK